MADFWSKRGKIFSAVTAMNLSKAVAQNNSVVELNLKEATESLKSQAKSSKIVDLPDGDPLFMFSFIPGKTRDLNIFWDTGCSHLMMKTDVPVKELPAVRTRKGPLTIKGAGDTAIKVGDEWVVLVPKEDGSQQMLIGVTSPQIAAPFPVFNTQEAFKELQERAPPNKKELISKMQVPPQVGGEADLLVGISFQNLFPELIYQLPCGLSISKTRLSPSSKGYNAVLGGPHSSFVGLCNQLGGATHLMNCFISGLKSLKSLGAPKIPSLPISFEEETFAQINKKEIAQIVDLGNVAGDPEDGSADLNHVGEEAHQGDHRLEPFVVLCGQCGVNMTEDPSEGVKDEIGKEKMKDDAIKESVVVDQVAEKISALSEKALLKLSDLVSKNLPRLAEMIRRGQFADDLADSEKPLNNVKKLTDHADEESQKDPDDENESSEEVDKKWAASDGGSLASDYEYSALVEELQGDLEDDEPDTTSVEDEDIDGREEEDDVEEDEDYEDFDGTNSSTPDCKPSATEKLMFIINTEVSGSEADAHKFQDNIEGDHGKVAEAASLQSAPSLSADRDLGESVPVTKLGQAASFPWPRYDDDDDDAGGPRVGPLQPVPVLDDGVPDGPLQAELEDDYHGTAAYLDNTDQSDHGGSAQLAEMQEQSYMGPDLLLENNYDTEDEGMDINHPCFSWLLAGAFSKAEDEQEDSSESSAGFYTDEYLSESNSIAMSSLLSKHDQPHMDLVATKLMVQSAPLIGYPGTGSNLSYGDTELKYETISGPRSGKDAVNGSLDNTEMSVDNNKLQALYTTCAIGPTFEADTDMETQLPLSEYQPVYTEMPVAEYKKDFTDTGQPQTAIGPLPEDGIDFTFRIPLYKTPYKLMRAEIEVPFQKEGTFSSPWMVDEVDMVIKPEDDKNPYFVADMVQGEKIVAVIDKNKEEVKDESIRTEVAAHYTVLNNLPNVVFYLCVNKKKIHEMFASVAQFNFPVMVQSFTQMFHIEINFPERDMIESDEDMMQVDTSSKTMCALETCLDWDPELTQGSSSVP